MIGATTAGSEDVASVARRVLDMVAVLDPCRPGSPQVRPPTLADLDATLTAVESTQAAVNALEGVRALLVDRYRQQAEGLDRSLLDPVDPTVGTASARRRRELAHRAAVADLATSLHVGESTAQTLVDHSATITQNAPRLLDAVLAGSVSWRHADVVARQIDDLPSQDAARVEASVLPAARGCTPSQLRARARRARETVHPTPPDVRHAEAATRRDVWLDPGRDGMAWLTAHLPAPFAHAAHDRLTSTATRLRADGEARTVGQLRADVLADLLLDDGTLDVGADSMLPRSDVIPPDGTRSTGSTRSTGKGIEPDRTGGPRPARPVGSLAPVARAIRPRVNVTVPVLSLLGVVDAPASLDGHVPIDAETARALCAHAPSFRRILTDPETGAVLSVGRSAYQAPADLKAVLAERDTTCRFPGCTRPVARTDLDHTVAWADGGTTDVENLAHLCRRHHVVKHQTRWRAEQQGDGALRWTSPTGRVRHTAPEPVESTRHRAPPSAAAPADPGPPPF